MRRIAVVAAALVVVGSSVSPALAGAPAAGPARAARSTLVAPPFFQVPDAASELAIADLNGDGLPDLVTGGEGHTLGVLLGTGRGFAPVVAYVTGGMQTLSIAVGDLNGDGAPDIVANEDQEADVWVLINRDDGTFAPGVGYPVTSFSYAPAIGDFDADGAPDIAVADASGVRVLPNLGDGTFGPGTSYPVRSPAALAVANVLGNGALDIVVARGTLQSGGVTVLKGRGDGTFTKTATYATGASPTSVSVADLNGDHRDDLGVVSGFAGTLSIVLSQGNGFAPPVTYTAGANPDSVVFSDLNGDGHPDAALADQISDAVQFMVNDGSGGFGPATAIQAGGGPIALVAGDFTGDGHTDLVAGSFYGVALLEGHGDGTFVTGWVGALPSAGTGVAAADLNGDGVTDLVASDEAGFSAGHGSVSAMLGNGDGTFGQPIVTLRDHPVGALAAADLDADGIPDVAIVEPGHGSSDVAILHGNADGSFTQGQVIALRDYPTRILAGHLNGDAAIDLVVLLGSCCALRTEVAVLLGNGDGTFAPPAFLDAGSFANSGLELADMNGDGVDDLIATGITQSGSHSRTDLAVLMGHGDGTFRKPVTSTFPGGNIALAVGDLNGDGVPDAALSTSSRLDIVLGAPDGTFSPGPGYEMRQGANAAAIAEVTGDGVPDILSAGNGVLSVLPGIGDGSFGAPRRYAFAFIDNQPSASPLMIVGDFNGDGLPDVAGIDAFDRVLVDLHSP